MITRQIWMAYCVLYRYKSPFRLTLLPIDRHLRAYVREPVFATLNPEAAITVIGDEILLAEPRTKILAGWQKN